MFHRFCFLPLPCSPHGATNLLYDLKEHYPLPQLCTHPRPALAPAPLAAASHSSRSISACGRCPPRPAPPSCNTYFAVTTRNRISPPQAVSLRKGSFSFLVSSIISGSTCAFSHVLRRWPTRPGHASREAQQFSTLPSSRVVVHLLISLMSLSVFLVSSTIHNLITF